MTTPLLYTIGHSNHSADYFLQMLQAHAVNCVADVRSVAASRYNPQYHKTALSTFLSAHQIAYLHVPEAFGARQTAAAVLTEGRVDFEKVRASASFVQGVERLKTGAAKGYTIALMCAESDPLDCHRFYLITPGLVEAGFEVQHILKDTTLRTTAALEEQLMNQYAKKIPEADLFQAPLSKEEQLKALYRLRNAEIGFKG